MSTSVKTLNSLVLGCFSGKDNNLLLTPTAKSFDDRLGGKLGDMLRSCLFEAKAETVKAFYELVPEYSLVVVTGLGECDKEYCPYEIIDLKLENIRCSVSKAIKVSEEACAMNISLDDCMAPKCVGEVVGMANHEVGQWKSKFKPRTKTFSLLSDDKTHISLFNEGVVYGEAQALAAYLAEIPSNLKAPAKLAQLISSLMPKNVKCVTRNKDWIKEKNMNLFLSVNQGSVEPAVLLEAHYKGSDSPPLILVGKGIVFDSGGISIKPAANMAEMKADMEGCAVVFAALRAIALLKLPIHVIAISPMTENLPSGSATKPGDVFVSMMGKTVEVDNTDAEGRLVLADALTYAETFEPSQIIDLATLTGAVGVALGSASCAIYTKNFEMLERFRRAAACTGDRVWHMPLFKHYSKLNESDVADLINCPKTREAGSCVAAAFLGEFVKTLNWAHLDIASVMNNEKKIIHTPAHMSGRPTRTLIEYIKTLSAK